MNVEVGQYWRSQDGILIKVLRLSEGSDIQCRGTLQVKRMDSGFVFWTHEIDLMYKTKLVPEKDVPLVLLAQH